jgi:CHAT domain-containing protein
MRIIILTIISIFIAVGNSAQTIPNYNDVIAKIKNGISYYDLGRYEKANDIFAKIEIQLDEIKNKNADINGYYTQSLYYLSQINYELGNNRLVEEYLIKTKQNLDENQPLYAEVLSKMGILYLNLSDFSNAEKCFMEAKIFYENHISDSYIYAELLISMCKLYNALEDYNKLRDYTQEVEGVLSSVQSESSIKYARLLSYLAESLSTMGDFFFGGYAANWKNMSFWKSQHYYDKAIDLYKNKLGRNNIDYCRTLLNYAKMLSRRAEFDEALKQANEAKQILEQIGLKNNFLYLNVLEIIYGIYLRANNTVLSQQTNENLCKILIDLTYKNFSFLSERQRTLYWERVKKNFEVSYSFCQPAIAYDNALFAKCLLLRSNIEIRNAINNSGNRQLIDNIEELDRIKSVILKSNDVKEIQRLEIQAEELDKNITLSSDVYKTGNNDIKITWQSIQNLLENDEVAIEFIQYSQFYEDDEKDSAMFFHDAIFETSTRYAALVLRKDREPVWIPLCEETELQECLKTKFDKDQTTKKDEKRMTEIYRANEKIGHKGVQLYRLVWEKLEKELQGVKNVYYSPAGLLHKVSFAAIPTGTAETSAETVTLFDKYNLHLVTSTREIKNLKAGKPETWMPKDSAAIYGGLQYYLHQDTMLATATAYRGSGSSGSMSWKYLTNSEKEAKSVNTLMKKKPIETTLYTGIYGNEESFKHLNGTKTKVILLSTHGFFLSDIEKKHDLLQSLSGFSQRGIENSLLRSGLILSGGGTKWDEPNLVIEADLEDGILTADEVSRMNLTDTKLVVMSACESGLGDAKNSEGVFGLQRAFKLAGVETIIMSLWQVSDEATDLLMTTFFTEWMVGKTKQDAFKSAQTKVREEYAAPYFWASFVMLD